MSAGRKGAVGRTFPERDRPAALFLCPLSPIGDISRLLSRFWKRPSPRPHFPRQTFLDHSAEVSRLPPLATRHSPPCPGPPKTPRAQFPREGLEKAPETVGGRGQQGPRRRAGARDRPERGRGPGDRRGQLGREEERQTGNGGRRTGQDGQLDPPQAARADHHRRPAGHAPEGEKRREGEEEPRSRLSSSPPLLFWAWWRLAAAPFPAGRRPA